MSSILEINENEYLIKLNRKRFNLSFVRSLLKMVEVSNLADDFDIADRNIGATEKYSVEPDYFGNLEEK